MTDELDPRRHLKLEGTLNTRDIGGYVTGDGRKTRWGQFLRSDSLHQLSAKDQQDLQRISSNPEVMLAVLRDLDERHCGVEGYARHVGVSQAEIDALRDAMVE